MSVNDYNLHMYLDAQEGSEIHTKMLMVPGTIGCTQYFW